MEQLVRQNYDSRSEALVNKQINQELTASYVYMAMFGYFSRADVALHGFAGYFSKASEEEREHALKLIEYQNLRGGNIVFNDIVKPAKVHFENAMEAVKDALHLEKNVNESLLELHKAADEAGDAQLCDFIESEYLEEQVKGIKELADLLTKINRAGSDLGLHIIDKELQEQKS